jgi:cyclopropane-fatty-acyl-phospholipid synthase
MFHLAAALPSSMLERKVESFIESWRGLDGVPLAIELWNGKRFELTNDPAVTLRINSAKTLVQLEHPGLDSLGEAYAEGQIDVDGHIRDVFRVVAQLVARFGESKRPKVFEHKHTKKVDAASIEHHYDVSNDFYRAWLDEQMVYSCAYFRSPHDTLEQAQVNKLDHILTKIQLKPGERLLDIGCGWGALVLRAAQKYGAQCVGITLSHRQFELATQRVKDAGLQDRVQIRLEDYRDTQGTFDKITSVGMFEHVGLANLRQYFTRVHDLLREGGVALNHGITSSDPDSGETPFGGGRFIDRYVFPNGELPHISLALKELAAGGLEATDVENLRLHYAHTLDHWTDRFEANGSQLLEMVGEKRYRVWRAYLAGCAYGFYQNWMALHQIVAVKLATPESNPLPMTRDYMYART